jgi:hypothetical protein
MTLSALIRRGGLDEVATATPATVAGVAGVAEQQPLPVVDTIPRSDGSDATRNEINRLHAQIQRCHDWNGLYSILDRAQTAFDDGQATQAEVESLVGWAADRSCQLPEHADAEQDHLSGLLARQPFVRVRSRLLGETVVWVADGAAPPKGGWGTVYHESELCRMAGQSPANVQAVHKVKRCLDGELI